MSDRSALGFIVAVPVACVSGGWGVCVDGAFYPIFLAGGLHAAPGLEGAFTGAMLTMVLILVSPLMAIIISPLAILIGGIPSLLGVLFIGRPLHRYLKQGGGELREYAGAGFLVGLGLALVCLVIDKPPEHFGQMFAAAVLFGATGGAAAFRLVSGDGLSHAYALCL